MERVIDIGGKAVKFKATALTPRIYRHKFGRDMIVDLNSLRESLHKTKDGEEFSSLDLEIFENAAYTMAKQADANIPETAEEWLDGFEMFNIYNILPELLALWGANTATTATPKKNKTNGEAQYRRDVHASLRGIGPRRVRFGRYDNRHGDSYVDRKIKRFRKISLQSNTRGY